MNKGLLFKLHMFTGLVSGVFIFIICLSGSLLVFHANYNHMLQPAVEVSDQPLLTLDSAYSSVKRNYPKAQISHGELPGSVNEPFVFNLYDSVYQSGSKTFPVFVHPQTGVTMGFVPNRLSFMNWLSVLHSSFHAGKKGE